MDMVLEKNPLNMLLKINSDKKIKVFSFKELKEQMKPFFKDLFKNYKTAS